MKKFESYGDGIPGLDLSDLTGWLIVIEGTDGVGRTTHVTRLRAQLERLGYAVAETGLSRSDLASRGIRRAKEGNTLGSNPFNLFYATDFADRLERQIIPALRAGFVMLTDRYTYSLIAREQPHLVVLCTSIDRADGFQLLSMLKLDPRTRDIPVVTYTTESEEDEEVTELLADGDDDSLPAAPPLTLH